MLNGKVAIVTGGGGGIGGSISRIFADQGARVLVCDLFKKPVDQANCEFVEHDVKSQASWNALVSFALEQFGGIDILVNNAGQYQAGDMLATTQEVFDSTMATNATGAMLGMQAVVPAMRVKGEGSIINICSMSAYKGTQGLFAYTASKWALRGMTRAAAMELGTFGIRVNGIFPGLIDTPMIAGIPAAQRSQIAASIPLGRLGCPLDVAKAALYLASAQSDWVSGTELVVSGGYGV